jgi:hypothetical protein
MPQNKLGIRLPGFQEPQEKMLQLNVIMRFRNTQGSSTFEGTLTGWVQLANQRFRIHMHQLNLIFTKTDLI